MDRPVFLNHLCSLRFFTRHGMRPRLAESESRGGFLGGEFGGGFNKRAQWIAHQAGVFPVRVVDAPELVTGLLSRVRAHLSSSAQGAKWWVQQLHNVRAES
jgi:hypothetical protein